jgi:DNA-binding response OmpR family regulator
MENKGNILVVDDEEATCEALKLMLSLHNYSIITANSAMDALEILPQKSFDLVLADLAMPGMDGLQLLEEVKLRYPELPVVIITAYPATDNIIQALRNGASDFVSKPYHPGELLSIVHRETQRKQQLEQAAKAQAEKHEASTHKTALVPPATLEFTPAQLRAIERRLVELRTETNARCVVLVESNGHVIDAKGLTEDIDIPALAGSVAKNFSATTNIASLIGEKEPFRLNYYEGVQYSIYSAQLQPTIFLMIIFGLDSRSGVVLYAMRQIIPRLQQAVS